jgi:REP element-mobilizing transposase RayT
VSLARPIYRGATYLITRKCSQRQFLLRPSKAVNDIFRFVLAVAARRYGVRVHAFCVLSNHIHLVVTDPEARLPDFQRDLGALVARAVNAELGRWEALWKPGSYSAVRLVTPAAIVNEVAYTLANPVAAGLVRTGRLWPGLWSDPELIGAGPTEVVRPTVGFFSDRGPLPETTSLELTVPPGFASAEEFKELVAAAVAEKEKEAQAGGRKFLGVAAVLAQKPTDSPRTPEPRRQLSPRVAARDKWMRIEALTGLKAFASDYHEAMAARRAGDLSAVFPYGTYLMRVLHNVPCAAPG